jgi:hypothetical protein
MEDILKFEYNKGKQEVFPMNNMVKNWLFGEDEHDEAALAHFIAKVAEKNGLSANDVQNLFPAILRMLKSDIPWSK